MNRTVWRIATDAPDYEADDLSGAGAQATGGRWNPQGTAVVYASATRALACLETVVHLSAGGLPLNRYLVEIDIPEDIWTAAPRETLATLRVGWDAEPPGRASIGFGAAWLDAGSSAVLFVPSAVVPEEFNILINPRHPDTRRITATKQRRWTYDPRLAARREPR